LKYAVRRTSRLKRDMKKLLKGGKDIEKLIKAVEILAEGQILPSEYKDHPLSGKYKGMCDCHIEPDWILIYGMEENELVLYRTGSHSDLFR
jgi:mRNA interferase YafQ